MPIHTPPSISAGAITFIEELTGSTGTLTFSAIVQTYRHLLFIGSLRSSIADGVEDVAMEFNGDTTAGNYRHSYYQIFGNALTAIVVGDTRIMARIAGANSPANSPGSFEIKVPYYSGVTFKKNAQGLSTARYATGGNELLSCIHWMEWENNAAITQVAFKLGSGNFSGKVAMYGIP